MWVVIYRDREVSTTETCLGRAARVLPAIARTLVFGKHWAPLSNDDVRQAAYGAYRRARSRAPGRGVAFEITTDDVAAMIEAQGRRCALTGLPLSLKRGRGRRRPYSPSLDRIDRTAGYTLSNVRVVCTIANLARGDFSDDEFYAMCAAAAAHRPPPRFVEGVDAA